MLDAVIDISHNNGLHLDFAAAKAAGILAVMHKVTQGAVGVDPMYAVNRKAILEAGLLLGAYHFGDGSDGSAQALYFLETVGAWHGRPLVLDLESNMTGPTMTPVQAQAFVETIRQRTGTWPLIYTGRWFLGGHVVPSLTQCPLWLPEYGSDPIVPNGWKSWSLWQWTDGCVGAPPAVPGIGHCDRSRFDGDEETFLSWWKSVAPA